MDELLARLAAAGVTWALADHLGSVRHLFNTAGSVYNRRTYDSFGTLASQTEPALQFAFAYTGRYTDPATGLQHNRARWYDPLNGRFNRVDPFAGNMQDPQSLHKYLYCHANPVNAVDPSGLFGKRPVRIAGSKRQAEGGGDLLFQWSPV